MIKRGSGALARKYMAAMSENVVQLVSQGFNLIQTRSTNDLSTYIVLLSVLGTILLIPNTIGTVLGPLSDPVGIDKITIMIELTAVAMAGFIARHLIILLKNRKEYLKTLKDLEKTKNIDSYEE